MKKFIFLLSAMLLFTSVYSQDVVLHFISANVNANLDSVHVTNMSKDCDTTLYGIEIFFFIESITTGYDRFSVEKDEIKMIKNMVGSSRIEINSNSSNKVNITLHKIDGKILMNKQFNISSGTHQFDIHGGKGTNILTVQTDKINKSFKLIESLDDDIGIVKAYTMPKFFKSVKNDVFVFSLGDFLQIEGYATGYFPVTIVNAPVAGNNDYFFDFEPSITGVVKGFIYHYNTHIPVESVHVTIAGCADITDSTGYYEINAPIGYHALYATKNGYENYGTTVSVTTNYPVLLDIELFSEIYTHTIYGSIGGNMPSCYWGKVRIMNPDGSMSELYSSISDSTYQIDSVPYGYRDISIRDIQDLEASTVTVNLSSDSLINLYTPEYLTSVCEPHIEHGGKMYTTVMINNQCWFKENLNIGTYVYAMTASDNGIIEKYCFNNDSTMCDSLGGLYDWNELMKYNDYSIQGLCPDGWHVPTDVDWVMLESYADSTYDGSYSGFAEYGNVGRGTNVGKQLRSEDWFGNDTYGFSAIGNGSTNGNATTWYGLEWGDHWTSTEAVTIGDDEVIVRVFRNTWHQFLGRFIYEKFEGKAVRCIKNYD